MGRFLYRSGVAAALALACLLAWPQPALSSKDHPEKRESNELHEKEKARAEEEEEAAQVDYSTWDDHHDRATPVWVLPKAVAPKNMEWTVPSLPGQVAPGSYQSPDLCGGCHNEIFSQWKGAMHANAWRDPVYTAVLKAYVKASKTPHERSETAMCTRCHTPSGYLSDDLGRYFVGELKGQGRQGVFCDFCHTVRASAGIGNGAFIASPGHIKWGPRDDSQSPFHESERSELHTRSEFCGQCHDVSHAESVLPIEATYSEWRHSPYFTGDPTTSVHCQDCHMRQTPRVASTGITERPDSPGVAAAGGKERKHVWQHVFIGGNAVVTELLGFADHAQMARDRLKHAARLKLHSVGSARPGRRGSIEVEVVNAGAGHYLPTGLTYVRQMWLEVVVTDAEGRVLLSSGAVDGSGTVDPRAVMYHTVLGDAEYKPTAFLPGAVTIVSDYRIPPKGSRLERYDFDVPVGTKGPLKAKAVLNYRSAPQKLINDLLGEKAPKVPVIEMAEALANIELGE